ncbi:MAG: YgcG family protein [Spirulina sp.]
MITINDIFGQMNSLLAKFSREQSTLSRLIVGLLTVLLAFAIAIAPAKATTIYELPNISAEPSPRAIDAAQVLSPLNEGTLNKSLKNLTAQTGKEVWLVAVRIGYGETVENFTNALFDRWFPAEEGSDRVLLVLDTLTNNGAIRVGEGLQELLPEDIAQSVATETLIVPVRSGGKYNQAFLDATDRLALVLSGEPDPGPPAIAEDNIESTFADAEETNDRNAAVWVIGFLVVATIVPMVTYYAYVGFPGR